MRDEKYKLYQGIPPGGRDAFYAACTRTGAVRVHRACIQHAFAFHQREDHR